LAASQDTGNPKVPQLDSSILAQKNILRLNVAMQNALLMQIINCKAHL
jgi:hypothetical protein